MNSITTEARYSFPSRHLRLNSHSRVNRNSGHHTFLNFSDTDALGR